MTEAGELVRIAKAATCPLCTFQCSALSATAMLEAVRDHEHFAHAEQIGAVPWSVANVEYRWVPA